jgi:hypothetical protein
MGFAVRCADIYTTCCCMLLLLQSVTMGQMYGEFDGATHEWQDGIMSNMYRYAINTTTTAATCSDSAFDTACASTLTAQPQTVYYSKP